MALCTKQIFDLLTSVGRECFLPCVSEKAIGEGKKGLYVISSRRRQSILKGSASFIPEGFRCLKVPLISDVASVTCQGGSKGVVEVAKVFIP
jgi:hypothetical protein